jgi:hypothetical protein
MIIAYKLTCSFSNFPQFVTFNDFSKHCHYQFYNNKPIINEYH